MKLRIGAHIWKVVFSERAIQRDSHEYGDSPLAGHCDKSKHRISITTKGSPSFLRECFLHEVLHAVCEASGLGDELGNEEKVVNNLTKVLLPALRDNPKLIDFLLED